MKNITIKSKSFTKSLFSLLENNIQNYYFIHKNFILEKIHILKYLIII